MWYVMEKAKRRSHAAEFGPFVSLANAIKFVYECQMPNAERFIETITIEHRDEKGK